MQAMPTIKNITQVKLEQHLAKHAWESGHLPKWDKSVVVDHELNDLPPIGLDLEQFR